MDLSEMRRHYALQSFDEKDAHPNPFEQFRTWFSEANEGKVLEPNAMTLATASSDGKPSARIVLLKEMIPGKGFVFFTNYSSRKGKELLENPEAALLFFWPELERQVRIEGRIQKIAKKDSAAYFHSRPVSSQLGAWASPQSSPIPNRTALDVFFAEAEKAHGQTNPIPLPDFWGGYILVPDSLEFWQGRESRLHDRIEYKKSGKTWTKQRLAP